MSKKQGDLKIRAFNEFDKLNLKPFAENLLQDIEKGTDSSIGEQGAYTISLNAEFGNGKTTFLEMFEHFVKEEKQNYNVFSINVWESDFYGEPVIAILSEFANCMKESCLKDKRKKTIEIIGRIGINISIQAICQFVQQIIQVTTGKNLDIKQALETLKNEGGKEIFDNFNQKKEAITEIKDIISEYTQDKKLLIIVDELDRAKPDYAVHFLEDMKHFFNIENVIFLVAVNRKQMEETVKCLYGQKLNFDGYYGKFFKLEIDLPETYKKIKSFVDDLIQKTNVKYDQNDRDHILKNFCFLFRIFELSLREMEHFIIIFNSILSNKTSQLKYIDIICYLFFSCLYFKEKNRFKKILSSDFTVDDLFNFLKGKNESVSIQKQRNIELMPLLRIIACSLMTKQSENEDKNKLQREIQDEENFKNEYDKILDEMHDPHRRFRYNYGQFALEICNKIDIYK